LAYTRDGYTTLAGLKSLVLNAWVPPPGWGHLACDT